MNAHNNHLPLHPAQLEVYYDQMMDVESPHYNAGGYVALKGQLQKEKLLLAYQTYLEATDIHKISFDFSQDQPSCYFNDQTLPSAAKLFDFSQEMDAEAAAFAWMKQEFNAPFDLYGETLYEYGILKISEHHHLLYCKYHHLLTDGFGYGKGLLYITEKYNQLVGAPFKEERLVVYRYEDEILKANAYLKSAKYEADRDYWLSRFQQPTQAVLTKRHDVSHCKKSETILFDIAPSQIAHYKEVDKQLSFSVQQLTLAALH
ncbi:MAG: condensation domain-containing protein, partial [Bacteroidota bacterium]